MIKLLTWNVNHRAKPKPIPDLVPDAIDALKPDVLVLTEYVRGPSHDSFLSRLGVAGLGNVLISPEVRGENSVMIASSRRIIPGCHTAPAIAPSVPSNFLHVELPEGGLQVMGIRIPDYSKRPRIRRACWDWLCSFAEMVDSSPTVMMGDFNSDPDYPKAQCGDCFARLEGAGWQHALPENGASYWTLKEHVPRRLDHAFVSRDIGIISKRYVDRIDGLMLANGSSYNLPDHAALEIVLEN